MIAKSLQRFFDNHTIAGAVTLVASKEKILGLEAIGFSDLATHRPMRTDSVFWIASMTKPMTGAGLMMLVDEQKVNVDDPVEKYLGEFAGQMRVVEKNESRVVVTKNSQPILVRDVLSHTSGLPFMSRVEERTGKIDRYDLSASVVGYAMTAISQERGTKFVYSNAGTNTAGRIIEAVSGMPYDRFMQSRFFDPLGMRDTTFWPQGELLSRLATAYKPTADKTNLEETPIVQLSYPLDGPNRYASPAGGLFSTAADCSRFLRMILNGGTFEGRQYLSSEAVGVMTRSQTGSLRATPEMPDEGYGFGWGTDGPRGFGHAGAFGTYMWIVPADDLAMVLMIHNHGFPGEDGPNVRTVFESAAREFRRSA
jgi:CubicO group peptidase (beta-lactamase class C family)